MPWWSRTKAPTPCVRSDIGVFTYDGRSWSAEFADGAVVLVAVGNELDTRAIDRASAVLNKIDQFKDASIRYAKEYGANAWDGAGDLVLEALDFTDILANSFGLAFNVSSNDDYTVNVEFKDGKPCEVWGAD